MIFASIFSGTRDLTFFSERSILSKEIYTTICASPRLMILNADFNEAFLNACLYGWCYTDTFVCLGHVCPCLCLSFVLTLSLPIVCVVFLPFMFCVVEFFDGWQILLMIF